MQLAEQLGAALAPLADPAKAAPMRAYMKDKFPFLGIQSTGRRQATLPLIRAARDIGGAGLLATARALWAKPEREYQYVALDLLDRHARMLGPGDVDAIISLARDKAWWDTVDALAVTIGGILRRARAPGVDPQRRMDEALRDADLWVRRIAMLHQLGWRGDTDERRLFAYSLAVAAETDFFIRKAIGWALRDYARHAPDAVRAFLNEHAAVLSMLTRREAGKHLDC